MGARHPWGLLLLVVAGGGLLPLQASLNAQVAKVAGSPPFAAAISFSIGFLSLALLVATGLLGRPRPGGLKEAPPWAYLGGMTGAWFIFLGALLIPVLGATRMMGMVIGGQLAMGLVIDHFGWLGIPRRPFTPRRWKALALVAVAVALLSLNLNEPLDAWTAIGMLAAFSAGCGIGLGFSANAQISRVTGHPLGGALMNFLVGAAVLSLAVALGAGGHPQWAGLPTAPWWTYLGGALGATYVTVGLIAIPRVGLAMNSLATVFGQLAMSIAIDLSGLFGPRLPLSPQKLAGAVLLLVAMAVMQLDQPTRPRD